MPTWTSRDNLGCGAFGRMWRRKKTEWKREEIWIQATLQGKVSFPSPCLCFRGLLDTKAIKGLLREIFSRSWTVSRNMWVASSPPCLAPMSSQMTRGVGQVKWHPLFSLSGKSLPIEMAAHRGFFVSRSLISLSRWFCLGVWNDIFSLKKKRFSPEYSCEPVTEKALDPEALPKLSEIHHERENCVLQGVELPSFWKVQSQRWQWHWYYAHIIFFLWEKRCVMGLMWDILTLKPWEFNDGHHELLLWRNVEVDGKRDQSDGWSSWMNTIISICRLIGPLSSGSQAKCGF